MTTALREHLIVDHDQQLKEETLEFETMEEFLDWKNTEETNTYTTYIKRNSSGKLLITGETRFYYVCHRSYKNNRPQKPEEALQRSRKSVGSCKVHRTCPSTLTATVGSTVRVSFYSTHIGHDLAVGHQRLPKHIRTEIAGKLNAGITPKRIIDDIRDCASGTRLQRVYLLENQDISNIKRDFKINYSTKLHDNDAVSVRLWVQSMMLLEDNPVLAYKEQGQSLENFKEDDFLLIMMTEYQKEAILEFGSDKICVDGTHGLTSYGFLMFTVMVVDSYGTGIPVAFCFANKEDTTTLTYFFKKIQENVGVLTADTFMSDDAPCMYKAWRNVMGPVKNQLLCSWHVRRNWFKNLSKIKGPNASEKKAETFEALKKIQMQTEEMAFYEHINKFTNNLLNDAEMENFRDYYLNTYANRYEKWAYCFRTYLGINTNMYMESFHKKLKYKYLDKKKCQRLDKAIHSILNLLRDVDYENLIKSSKQKVTSKILLIRKAHRLAADGVEPKLEEEDIWSIPSSKSNLKYFIKKVRKTDGTCPCDIICDVCNICIHNYQCDCVDNAIRHNICRHIHMVSRADKTPKVIKCSKGLSVSTCPPSISNSLCSNSSHDNHLDVQALCDKIRAFDESVFRGQCYRNVAKALNGALESLQMESKHPSANFTSVERITPNENTKLQLRFTNKRKRM